MPATEPGKIRNIAVVGHRGVGKTSLAEAMLFQAGKINREDVFVATKLWNNNHRPERVKPAFEASLRRLRLDCADLRRSQSDCFRQPARDREGKC